MSKKLLSIMLAVVLVCAVALSGCGGNTATPPAAGSTSDGAPSEAASRTIKEKPSIYIVTVMSGGAAWGQYEAGFNKACEELGWDGHYLAPQSFNSAAELVTLCETAITNGADILLPVIVDNDAFSDVLDSAKAKNIPMVGVQVDDSHLDAVIGTDPVNLGYAIAEALVQVMGDEPINVATMQTGLAHAIQNTQREAFEKKLLELRPDAKVVDRLECNSNAATSADKISATYLANPDCNSMVSFDSYAGLGGAAFVEEKGLQGKFKVVGIDDGAEILRCIKSGTMACTVAQMWYDIGYKSVYIAKDVYEGKTVDHYSDAGSAIILADQVDKWAADHGIDMSAA